MEPQIIFPAYQHVAASWYQVSEVYWSRAQTPPLTERGGVGSGHETRGVHEQSVNHVCMPENDRPRCWYAGKIICGCIIGIATNVYCCYTYYTSATVHVHCTQTVTHCLRTPWYQEFGLQQASHHPTARDCNSGHVQQTQTVFLALQAAQPQRRSFGLAAWCGFHSLQKFWSKFVIALHMCKCHGYKNANLIVKQSKFAH